MIFGGLELLLLGFPVATAAGLGFSATVDFNAGSWPEQAPRGYPDPRYGPQAHDGVQSYDQQHSHIYGPVGAREVRLQKASNDHFYAEAEIDGGRTMALIDTGATGVAISPQWARAIGWDLRTGNFTHPVNTGNGVVYAHRLELPEIRVAGLTARGVDAIIHHPSTRSPDVIGMSFFNKLRSVQMAGGEMVLRG